MNLIKTTIHVVTVTVLLCIVINAHVQMEYPPSTLDLDFLDNIRTSGICGHEASGSDNSDFWLLPVPDETTITELTTDTAVNVSW